jgi:hypothetical protein
VEMRLVIPPWPLHLPQVKRVASWSSSDIGFFLLAASARAGRWC